MSPGRRRARGSLSKPSLDDEPSESVAEERLYTSDDLFGDLVDARSPESAKRAPGKRGPIRVRIAESGGSGKTESLDEVKLPQDMAQLLDALDDGSAHSRPAEAPAPLDDLRDALASESPGMEMPDTGASMAEGEEDDGDEDSLVSLLESASSPMPWNASVVEHADSPARSANRQKRPGAKSRGTRFRVVPPPEMGEVGLDLAAVVEEALGPPKRAESARSGSSGDRFFGPYQLLDKIATGGMAEVYRTKRTGVEGFEKVVAVKRILRHLSDNKEFVEMFVNEAKMVAGLTHPNIVQIFDLGRIGKSYFIAMEYVHGRDLRSIIRRTRERGMRIPLDLSIFIASRVCQALEYAHRKRDDQGRSLLIVHRDVSPQNILISFEGEVKLTDFGIARAAAKARTTDSGALRGKLLYMSPEQAWGRPMDRRSDLFSLGLVFYEMITDQKPFMGGSESGILDMVRECRIAPPSSVNPRIPDRIERVVMKALARDPVDRYQEAGELYKDLDRILYERPQPPTMAELGRFMSVLFDERERGAPQPVDEPIEFWHSKLEMEFDSQYTPTKRPTKAQEKTPSVKKLLRRLGLK